MTLVIDGKKQSITNSEIIRVIDLALRRMVDGGIENYSPKEQILAEKIQIIKQKFGKKYGGLL